MTRRFRGAFLRNCLPEPIIPLDEWANRFSQLGSNSARPGLWRTSEAPYMKEIHDCLCPTSPVQTVILRKPGQIGGTTVANNFIGHIIDQNPGPAMMIMATEDTARENSKLRIDAMINASPRLKKKVARKSSKEATNNVLHKDFVGGRGWLMIATAGSSAALASKAVQFMVFDEFSKYPAEIGDEGDPFALGNVRTVTFGSRRKVFGLSTPTEFGTCRVTRALEQCQVIKKYRVPCPFCKEFQDLVFDNLRFERDEHGLVIPGSIFYECKHCHEGITEKYKPSMVRAGRWFAVKGEGIQEPTSIGFDGPSVLYTLIGQNWFRICEYFLSVKDRPSELKVFVTGWLGEPWVDRGDAPDHERLYRHRREDYYRGIVPEKGVILTAAADVQADRIETTIEAWGRGRQCWLVDHQILTGDTATGEPWDKLTEFLNRTVPHASGVELPISLLALDTGFRTHGSIGAYNWAREQGQRVMAIKGRSSRGDDWVDAPVIVSGPRRVDVHLNHKTIYDGLWLYTIGVSRIKSEIFGLLKLEPPGPGEPFPDFWRHYPLDLDEEFFRQLASEALVTRKDRKGQSKGKFWVKIYERNEQLDLAVMNRAAAHCLDVDRFTDDDWDCHEELLTGRDPDPRPRGPAKWIVSEGVQI